MANTWAIGKVDRPWARDIGNSIGNRAIDLKGNRAIGKVLDRQIGKSVMDLIGKSANRQIGKSANRQIGNRQAYWRPASGWWSLAATT